MKKKKQHSVYAQTGTKKKKLPSKAKGNPAYEQTSESQPLWCCGILFGPHSRLAVFVLSIIGIACSIWLLESADYFKFTTIRNDTFYEKEKKQPDPFEYATVAKVGLFWYQIDEVFQYPWPPPKERLLFQDMLQEEVKRLSSNGARYLQTTTTVSQQPSATPSMVPSVSHQPSVSPSSAPTPPGNPNLLVAESVQLGVALKYTDGMDQFDTVFYNAQLGGLLGPIFCGLALLTGLAEYCFCYFKCSWLFTGIFLFFAFFFQAWTLFLFLSDDFCNYSQTCRLGAAGYGSILAVLCYLTCDIVICCMPRPQPLFRIRTRSNQTTKKKSKNRSSRYDVDEEDARPNQPKKKKKRKKKKQRSQELDSMN